MQFALGVVAGLVLACFNLLALLYFRKPVEKAVEEVERKADLIARHIPRQGFVFEPEEEIDEARERIIERNKAAGRDTPISDLQ